MVGLPPYAGDASPEALERAYLGRDVIYLLGTKDTNPQHRALDRSCMAEAQGPYRLARGLAYTRYLRKRHGAAFQQLVFMVPGVGHGAKGILTSSCGLNALFAASPADHAEADRLSIGQGALQIERPGATRCPGAPLWSPYRVGMCTSSLIT